MSFTRSEPWRLAGLRVRSGSTLCRHRQRWPDAGTRSTMQINWHDSGHTPLNPRDPRPEKFMKPFPDSVAYYDNPQNQKERVARLQFDALVQARRYLDVKVQEHGPCNECFRRLPGRRSFKEVYNDPNVWINYMDVPEGPAGFTNVRSKDIGIHAKALTRGYLYVAAVMVHELAHINGAPGTKDNQIAENTLKCCLLASQFDPNVLGTIKDFTSPDDGDAAYT